MVFILCLFCTGLVFQARDGSIYTLRRVTQADGALLEQFLQRLSDHTRQMRFMSGRPYSREFAHAEAARMLKGSAGRTTTLVATREPDRTDVVAVAELACVDQHTAGEIALVVIDEAQRRGIGTFLLHKLVGVAQKRGLLQLHANASASNEPMLRLMRGLQLPYIASINAGEMQVIAQVPQAGVLEALHAIEGEPVCREHEPISMA